MALCLVLCSCLGVVAAGAAAGMVVNDARSVAQINQDLTIDHRVRVLLARDPKLEDTHLVISCYKQTLFIGGQVPQTSLKPYALRQAMTVPGITRAYNQITVGPNNTAKGVAEDSWISAKVKAQMIARHGLKSGSINVVTEENVVYLIGAVSHDQANLAVDVARRVNGVKRVVKLFRYSD